MKKKDGGPCLRTNCNLNFEFGHTLWQYEICSNYVCISSVLSQLHFTILMLNHRLFSEELHFLEVVFLLLLIFFVHVTEEDHLLLFQSDDDDDGDDDAIMMMVMITCSSQRAVLFSSFSSMSPMGGSSPFGGCWLLFKACGLWGKYVVVQVVWYFLFQPPESLHRGGMSLQIFSASTLCASQEGRSPEKNE